MKVIDKNLPPTLGPRGGKHPTKVNVLEADCLQKKCYHPHPNKGSFTQGRGYTSYYDKPEWCCITRENSGCPNTQVLKEVKL
jgi:hypothetical protein